MKTAPALFGPSATKSATCPPASTQHSSRGRQVASLLALVFLVAVLEFLPGCSLLRFGKGSRDETAAQPQLVDEQIQLQRFTDDFLARGGQALDDTAERLGTDAGREDVLRLKLLLGSSLLSAVSGQNPNANLLDVVSITVLTRLSVQNYWMKTSNGVAFQPMLNTSRVLETNVWDLAGRFLRPAQVNELRRGIEQWYAETPEVHTAFFARPHALASMVRTSQGNGTNTVFSLVSLDPFAGLEPAVREVTQSRLFAERAMYTAQRMPFFLRLQAEQTAYEVAEQPAVRLAISNSTQLSDSAERVSRAAESVSQSISQMPDRLTEERKAMVATFEAQQGKLRDLAAGLNEALISGEKMSSSLSITITNFENLMKRFGVGEPRTNASNARPFNPLEYAKAADEIDKAAKDLNTLFSSLNQDMPAIQRMSHQTTTDAEAAEGHAFRLGLALIAVLLAGSVLAGLFYTFLAQKLKQRGAAKPGP